VAAEGQGGGSRRRVGGFDGLEIGAVSDSLVGAFLAGLRGLALGCEAG